MAILLIKVTVVSKEATNHFNLTPPYGQVKGCVSILKTDNVILIQSGPYGSITQMS